MAAAVWQAALVESSLLLKFCGQEEGEDGAEQVYEGRARPGPLTCPLGQAHILPGPARRQCCHGGLKGPGEPLVRWEVEAASSRGFPEVVGSARALRLPPWVRLRLSGSLPCPFFYSWICAFSLLVLIVTM